MERNQSPFGIERRLTPELFDHYVAKARTERAKAIAAFFGRIAGWLSQHEHHDRWNDEKPGQHRESSDGRHADRTEHRS
jgi:hypothetical protein